MRCPLIGHLVLVTGVALVPAAVWADRVVIQGGTELRGVVLPADPEHSDLVQILTSTTSKPFEFHKEQLLKVIPETDEMSGYLDQLAQAPPTAEGEFELGQWCEDKRLTGPAQRHFRRAVEQDPQMGPAHEKLGHVFHNGRWMTRDQKQEAQGLVKHKGRWVSPQQKEALDQKIAFTTEQQAWVRRLRLIREHWFNGNPTQRQDAEAQLSAIREPSAVQPLLRAFSSDPEPARQRLGQVLGGIPGPESCEALIWLVLAEPQLPLRQSYLHELELRHDPETANRFLNALDSRDPIVVGHAAWALGMLQAVSAVPKLISVLVKVEERMVVDDSPPAPGYSVGFGGVVGMNSAPLAASGLGTATGATAGAQASGVSGTGVPGGMAGTVGFGTLTPLPVLTGPVVAPGAVAFGATSVPYMNGVGLGTGNGGSLRPSAQVVTNVDRNEEVRQALISLTGEDYGFDVPSWRQWQTTQFKAAPSTPQRRVRQP